MAHSVLAQGKTAIYHAAPANITKGALKRQVPVALRLFIFELCKSEMFVACLIRVLLGVIV